MDMAAWLPITWQHTIVIASDWVGLTFPGIILDPGSLAGKDSSPIPHLGPEPSHLMSFAIFINETARVFSAPDAETIASWAANWENLFSALMNGRPVCWEILVATFSEKSGWVFNPVPTAVPPNASSNRSANANSILRISASNMYTYPENSWPRVSGTASMRCVLPILTIEENSCALASKESLRWWTEGSSWFVICSAEDMCIAVGNVSLLDCALFTWSFGWTGVLLPNSPPASSIALLAMTSFAFIFVWVPDPVCQILSGKCPSRLPEITSSHDEEIREAMLPSSWPSWELVSAAAFFRIPKALITALGIMSSPISKFSRDLAVWAP